MAREVIQPGFRIAGWGAALPERIVTNEEVAARIITPPEFADRPTTPKWIVKQVGIFERRYSDPAKGETTAWLASVATSQALQRANFEPETIDAMIVATCTSSDSVPSTAAVVQENLGLTGANIAFDIDVACSGFVYSIAIAHSLMMARGLKRIAVAGSDRISSIIDLTDRDTAPLFGDGSGAWVLEATDDDCGLMGSSFIAAGNRKALHAPLGGTVKMDGQAIFKLGVEYMVQCAREAMDEAEVTPEEVELLVEHQANLRMNHQIERQLGIPRERVARSIKFTGNCSAGTIGLAFDHYMKSNELNPGDIIVATSAGGGPAGAAVVIKW